MYPSLPLHTIGGAYFPAAAAYMAAVSASVSAAAAAALSPLNVDVPGGGGGGGGGVRPSSTHCSSKSSDNSSSQIRVYNPSLQPFSPHFSGGRGSLMNADDLFNKQLKKAADDFIPEHTVEDAEAPKSTPASPVRSPERPSTVRTYSVESGSRNTPYADLRDRSGSSQQTRHDRDHAMDFSSVYVEPGES